MWCKEGGSEAPGRENKSGVQSWGWSGGRWRQEEAKNSCPRAGRGGPAERRQAGPAESLAVAARWGLGAGLGKGLQPVEPRGDHPSPFRPRKESLRAGREFGPLVGGKGPGQASIRRPTPSLGPGPNQRLAAAPAWPQLCTASSAESAGLVR